MPNYRQDHSPPPGRSSSSSSADACPITGKAGRAWSKNAKTVYGFRVSAEAADSFAFMRRFAFGVDFVLYLIATGILGGIFGPKAPAIIWWITWVIFCTKDGWNNGQSPGKMLFGLRVVNEGSGKPFDAVQSFFRNLPLLLWIPLFDSGVWIPVGIFIVMAGIEKGKRLGDGFMSAKVVWLQHEKSDVFAVGGRGSKRDRGGYKPATAQSPWMGGPLEKLGATLNELQEHLREAGQSPTNERIDHTPHGRHIAEPPPLIRPHEPSPASRTGGAVYRGKPSLQPPSASPLRPEPQAVPSPHMSPHMSPMIEVKPWSMDVGSDSFETSADIDNTPTDRYTRKATQHESPSRSRYESPATKRPRYGQSSGVDVMAGMAAVAGVASDVAVNAAHHQHLHHPAADGYPHLNLARYPAVSHMKAYDDHNVAAIDVADENGGFRHALYNAGLAASRYVDGTNIHVYDRSAAGN